MSKMRTTKVLREYKRRATRLGAHVETAFIGGVHYRITLEFQGREKTFYVSTTPSDNRTMLNFESVIKKWLREQPHQSPNVDTLDAR